MNEFKLGPQSIILPMTMQIQSLYGQIKELASPKKKTEMAYGKKMLKKMAVNFFTVFYCKK